VVGVGDIVLDTLDPKVPTRVSVEDTWIPWRRGLCEKGAKLLTEAQATRLRPDALQARQRRDSRAPR
jgi:hypothetical protein